MARRLAEWPLLRYGFAMTAASELCATAARNNAAWCDAMARVHGAAGELTESAWVNRSPAPRFYPNLVTLRGTQESASHMDAIRRLMAHPPAHGWAVKDSFAALDLGRSGFRLLFDAVWIHRPARAFDAAAAKCRALRVADEAMLAGWEEAWAGGMAEAGTRLFRAALLAEPDHAVIAARRDDRIVAGCIASRSDGVLGISNLFTRAQDDNGLRAACMMEAMRFAPGLPLVGYESGGDLDAMTALGFAEIGPLRVWQAEH